MTRKSLFFFWCTHRVTNVKCGDLATQAVMNRIWPTSLETLHVECRAQNVEAVALQLTLCMQTAGRDKAFAVFYNGARFAFQVWLLSCKSFWSKHLSPTIPEMIAWNPERTATSAAATPHRFAMKAFGLRNIWALDSSTLEPVMVFFRPVKEKSGACFGKAGVIELFRNALWGSSHKTLKRCCFVMSG